MIKLSALFRLRIFTVIALLGVAAVNVAHSAQAPSVPSVGAPELAALGPFGVGTFTKVLTFPGRVHIISPNKDGDQPVRDRKVTVRMWYPATVSAATQPVRYARKFARAGKPPIAYETLGIAVSDAVAVENKRFPLVVVSHGFGGWDTSTSHLTENLASKGYVVAAIEHADAPFTNFLEFQLSFGNVILDRAQDQRQTIAALIHLAKNEKTGIGASIDPEQVGLIGYSMGGFGAISTAGADYDANSNTITQLPEAVQKLLVGGNAAAANPVKALVALAPWGGQVANRSWTASALAQVKVPVLLISGDGDDVVDYEHGVTWIFDNLTGSNRQLLSFRNARHNIGGNPAPTAILESGDFKAIEYFVDPVWRTDRLNVINQHFITAFLDVNLKGQANKAAYLDTPTIDSNDGEWPAAFGEQYEGKPAGASQAKYWRGFPRRWATGLRMYKAKAGVAGTLESPKR